MVFTPGDKFKWGAPVKRTPFETDMYVDAVLVCYNHFDP